MRDAEKRPERLATTEADTLERLEVMEKNLDDESQAIAAARRRETDRLALELQPRHREACHEIGRALEALSLATVAEREARDELRRRAPLRESKYLPDMSSDLLVGCLGDRESPAWRWRRTAHKVGIYK
jgi:hypothetical protein